MERSIARGVRAGSFGSRVCSSNADHDPASSTWQSPARAEDDSHTASNKASAAIRLSFNRSDG